VETSLRCKFTLKNVRHVPDMRLHLISVGALDDDGYQSHFFGEKWKLLKGLLVVARGIKFGSLYVTQVKMCGEVNVSECNSIDLWHLQLGHMSENGIEILSKKNYVPDDGTSLTSCTHYLAGKQHRVAFRRNPTSKKSSLLDLMHTDLCSMRDRSIDDALYFVTFVDNHSRKLWTYSLKTNDQVLNVFKQWVVEVERETGRKLKCVRSDNGGEYRSPFETFCKTNDIKLEKTIP
jgi:Integrase core domain/GAG-pre-integrase domain